MRRRELLKGMTAAALGMGLRPSSQEAWAEEPKQSVKTVYVIYKCHLDIGYTDTERGVIRTYFDDYLPRAMDTAERLRKSGGEERYVWTITAWMMYEYLEQASLQKRKRMDQAIADGDIAWHAMPFTWESEMLDRSLITSALKLSASLDQRYGTKTIAGKMTDVPSHTRGLIGPLAEAGIKLLDIGNNPVCQPPGVPFIDAETRSSFDPADDVSGPEQAKFLSLMLNAGVPEKEARRLATDTPEDPHCYLFNWRDPEGAQIMMLYHPFEYGSTVAIPGTDIAVSVRVRGDNSGPHAEKEILASYATLRKMYPGARIVATNLSTVARALETLRPGLPVLTKEIGDPWIYGVGSDPGKVAQYRELCRLRKEWLSEKRVRPGDPVDLAFTSRLILATEHNWGLATGRYLAHPEVQSPKELAQARATIPEFKKNDAEWVAKRAAMDAAVAALPEGLREEARKRLKTLTPVPPDTNGLAPLAPGAEVQTRHFAISMDPATGAIKRLQDRKTGREWALAQHPLAEFGYQMFTKAESDRFNHEYYTTGTALWQDDLNKPGLENYPVQNRIWKPTLQRTWAGADSQENRIVAELQMPAADAGLADLVSWPKRLTMEIRLPKAEPAVYIALCCFDKPANRLCEAMWLSFSPDAPDGEGWLLEKTDQPVSPHEVVENGNRHLHAVTREVSYRDAKGSFTLETLDAPLVAPGQRALYEFDNKQPDLREGIHINLFNNLWCTAFPQWYGDDMQFRFVIRV